MADEAKPVVKYKGFHHQSHVREITKADWGKAGIQNQETVAWSSENEYQVPVEKLSAEALALLKKDPEFQVPAAK